MRLNNIINDSLRKNGTVYSVMIMALKIKNANL